MNPVNGIGNSPLGSSIGQSIAKPGSAQDGQDFTKQLMDVLNDVNGAQNNALQKQNDLMTGQHNVDYHDLMIDMEKASIALQLTVAVRNKLLEAYQSVSQTQI